MGNMGLNTLGFRPQKGGCGCSSPTLMTGGWKYTRRASLASKKRLSSRMSRKHKPNKKPGKKGKSNKQNNRRSRRKRRVHGRKR
jgi:hypothetical protein